MQNPQHQVEELQKLKTGTTTLALKFKDGVILASDRQATTYYRAGKVQKIFMLTKEESLVGVSIAGSAGDALSLVDLMRSELKLYKFENNHQASVKTATSLLSVIMYNGYRRYQPYFVGFLVAGVDNTGSHIYSMDMIGSTTDEDYASTGSGSLFALSKLEDGFKKDLSKEEAKALAIKAIKLAANRDLYTGYGVDLLIITKDGTERDGIDFPRILDN
jgi:proteasome beta subunit